MKLLLTMILSLTASAAECQPTISASCSFYECAEKQKKCGNDSYLINSGLKYCNLMTQNVAQFSPGSRVVIAELLRCQQNYVLTPLNNKEAGCAEVESMGYESMRWCYSNHGSFSNQSMCDLPYDWAKWLKLVKQTEPVDELAIKEYKSIGTYCGLTIMREVWLNFGMAA